MATARAYAIDNILRDLIGNEPAPPSGVLILTDQPSLERIEVRYQVGSKTYVLSSYRLRFERSRDGSLQLSPCPPRRPPTTRKPGSITRRPRQRVQTASWSLRGPNRLVDTGVIFVRA